MKKKLLIIDIQYDFLFFRDWTINKKLLRIHNYLLNNKEKFKEEYNHIVQIVDQINYTYNVNDYSIKYDENTIDNYWYLENGLLLWNWDSEIFYEELSEEELLNKYTYSNILDNLIYKEYGFLRDYMDIAIKESEDPENLEKLLFQLINIMYKNDIYSTTDLTEDFIKNLNVSEDDKLSYLEMFLDFDYYHFSLPNEYNFIIEIFYNFDIDDHIDLIGWWKEECLKEVYYLMKWLWFKNLNIREDLIY